MLKSKKVQCDNLLIEFVTIRLSNKVQWLGKQRGREGGWSRGPDGSLGGHAQGHHVTAAVAADEDPEVCDLLRED